MSGILVWDLRVRDEGESDWVWVAFSSVFYLCFMWVKFTERKSDPILSKFERNLSLLWNMICVNVFGIWI